MSKPSRPPAGGPPPGQGFGSLPRPNAAQAARTRAEVPEWDSSFLLKAILGGLLLVILILGAIFTPGIYERWRVQRDRLASLDRFDSAIERRDAQAALDALNGFFIQYPEDFRANDRLAEFLDQPPDWIGTDQIASLESLLRLAARPVGERGGSGRYRHRTRSGRMDRHHHRRFPRYGPGCDRSTGSAGGRSSRSGTTNCHA